ncbi:MAG: hypothetical protein WAQ27_06180 [Candidatus Microsaccharimonas sp.]
MGFGIQVDNSPIYGASDVVLNNPANNDVLTYDSSIDKWKNVVGSSGGAVSSVAGRTGAVVLAKADVGLGSVDNTSDAAKPISSATQTALNAKIDVASLSANWGVQPTLYWNGSSWPARTVPSGYSWAVIWDSASDEAAPAPSASIAGDRWLRRVA